MSEYKSGWKDESFCIDASNFINKEPFKAINDSFGPEKEFKM